MISRKLILTLTVAAGALLGACESDIRPLQPNKRVEAWVEDAPDTQAATQAGGQVTTRPGHKMVKVVDPNQSVRYVYKARYDTIWQQAMLLLQRSGFAIDRKDYRLGVLTSVPTPSAQIVEFWKPEHVNPKDAMENTLNSQDRIVRVIISKVEGKPDFYSIGVQVIVERETNPDEEIGGPVFVEGSGFGRNIAALRSDYNQPNTETARWVVVGHDPDLENKLLNELFNRI